MSQEREAVPRWVAVLAFCGLLGGLALAVGGVYLLAGAGWALLTAAVPCMAFGAILARGLPR